MCKETVVDERSIVDVPGKKGEYPQRQDCCYFVLSTLFPELDFVINKFCCLLDMFPGQHQHAIRIADDRFLASFQLFNRELFLKEIFSINFDGRRTGELRGRRVE